MNSVVVDPNGLAALPPRQPSTVAVSSWTPEHRQVEVDAKRQSYLTVNENFNKGWQAKVDGVTLRPVRVDGWRQAWVVPAGTIGTVTMSYGPDLPYRAAVLFGLNLLVVLFVAAVWPSRRGPKPVVGVVGDRGWVCRPDGGARGGRRTRLLDRRDARGGGDRRRRAGGRVGAARGCGPFRGWSRWRCWPAPCHTSRGCGSRCGGSRRRTPSRTSSPSCSAWSSWDAWSWPSARGERTFRRWASRSAGFSTRR